MTVFAFAKKSCFIIMTRVTLIYDVPQKKREKNNTNKKDIYVYNK